MKTINKNILLIIAGLFCLGAPSCYKPDVEETLRPGATVQDDKYYIGSGLSYSSYLEKNTGSKYKNTAGDIESPFVSVKKNGGNIVHLSLALGDYTSEKASSALYRIDYHSYENVKNDFKKAKEAGLEVFLSLLYEKGLTNEDWLKIPDGSQMEEAIYNYATDVLEDFASEGMYPTFVAVGGDYDFVASNGLFMCRTGDNENNARQMVNYMNSAYKAVKDFSEKHNLKIKTVFHASKADDVARLLGRFYTNEYALNFDVLGVSYVFDTGNISFETLGELSVYMKIIYEKEFIVVGASFPYTMNNSDKIINIYNRLDVAKYGSVYSEKLQSQMFIDFTIDILQAGGLGVIAEKADFVGNDLWFAGNPWKQGSDWDNRTFWDKDYTLHEGIRWMEFNYKPYVKRNY